MFFKNMLLSEIVDPAGRVTPADKSLGWPSKLSGIVLGRADSGSSWTALLAFVGYPALICNWCK